MKDARVSRGDLQEQACLQVAARVVHEPTGDQPEADKHPKDDDGSERERHGGRMLAATNRPSIPPTLCAASLVAKCRRTSSFRLHGRVLAGSLV